MRQRIEDRVALAAALVGAGEHFAEGDGSFGGSNRIHDHDPIELCLRAHGGQLFVLLAGGDDGDAAAGILQQGGNLVAGQRRINGHVGGADGQGGEIAHRPLPAVFTDQANAVALLRAPVQQRFAQRADALVHLVGGDGPPTAEIVLP